MSLINTATDRFIANPMDQYSKIKVDAVWIIPTQAKKHETIVQVIFMREAEIAIPEHYVPKIVVEGEGEDAVEVEREELVAAIYEGSDPRLDGYVALMSGQPFNIGNAETHMGLPTFEQDLHDFVISVLGSTFEKI